MSKELIIFNFEGRDIRSIVNNETNEPLFVANDIASALGYTNCSRDVERHCKYVKLLGSTESVLLGLNPRGVQIIPESDVYRLIMRSNLPEAEKFQDWITEEVLPSIRKHGIYATPKTVEDMINDPDMGIKLLKQLKKERAEREIAEKKNVVLSEKLGIATDWKQVKAIPWLSQYFILEKKVYTQIGKELSRISRLNNIEIKQIEDSEYGYINAYHRSVITGFEKKLMKDPNYMFSIRRLVF